MKTRYNIKVALLLAILLIVTEGFASDVSLIFRSVKLDDTAEYKITMTGCTDNPDYRIVNYEAPSLLEIDRKSIKNVDIENSWCLNTHNFIPPLKIDYQPFDLKIELDDDKLDSIYELAINNQNNRFAILLNNELFDTPKFYIPKGTIDCLLAFCEDDFYNGLTIDGLFFALKQDGISVSEFSIEALNELLNQPDLYGKLKDQRSAFVPSENLIKYVKLYEENKDVSSLKRINRIALEEFYPQKMPKRQNSLNLGCFTLERALYLSINLGYKPTYRDICVNGKKDLISLNGKYDFKETHIQGASATAATSAGVL